jgi:hypothetical protein
MRKNHKEKSKNDNQCSHGSSWGLSRFRDNCQMDNAASVSVVTIGLIQQEFNFVVRKYR